MDQGQRAKGCWVMMVMIACCKECDKERLWMLG